MSAHDAFSAIRSVLEANESILLAYVFGSVGRGSPSSQSDVDVAVLARTELRIDELARLSEELGRALAFSRRVDIVDLRAASPVLAAEIVRDGERVVERDPLVRFDFETDSIRRFEDTRALRRIQHDLLREAARGPA